MPASDSAPAAAPNRSRWMRLGHDCMVASDWAGAIRAYGQGLLEQPLLGMHYATNLERARTGWRQERLALHQREPAHTQVVVVAAELSHNAAGRAFTLARLHQHLGNPVALLGSHFPQWGRQIWQPIQTAVEAAQLPVHTFVAEHEPRYVEQAFALVLQHPADLAHLSKPRLPAVVIGLLYKLLWGAAVLVDIDDEELCFVGEREPITLATKVPCPTLSSESSSSVQFVRSSTASCGKPCPSPVSKTATCTPLPVYPSRHSASACSLDATCGEGTAPW